MSSILPHLQHVRELELAEAEVNDAGIRAGVECVLSTSPGRVWANRFAASIAAPASPQQSLRAAGAQSHASTRTASVVCKSSPRPRPLLLAARMAAVVQ